MGLFDSVWFECPNKCNTMLEVQSKAGERILRDYGPESAPPEIASDIIGERVWCSACNKSFAVRGEVFVHLRLE